MESGFETNAACTVPSNESKLSYYIEPPLKTMSNPNKSAKIRIVELPQPTFAFPSFSSLSYCWIYANCKWQLFVKKRKFHNAEIDINVKLKKNILFETILGFMHCLVVWVSIFHIKIISLKCLACIQGLISLVTNSDLANIVIAGQTE